MRCLSNMLRDHVPKTFELLEILLGLDIVITVPD